MFYPLIGLVFSHLIINLSLTNNTINKWITSSFVHTCKSFFFVNPLSNFRWKETTNIQTTYIKSISLGFSFNQASWNKRLDYRQEMQIPNRTLYQSFPLNKNTTPEHTTRTVKLLCSNRAVKINKNNNKSNCRNVQNFLKPLHHQ